MANKKLNQLVTKPSIGTGDLFPLADATTGQLYKTTISDLGTAIGSGVSSVNTLVGAVVLDTDDIQELASPVNKWYTDLRARAAISAGTGISYNSGTGVITNTITQYTDALARAAVSLTTTGSNGSATYNSTTGVLNVPSYTLSGLGGQPLAGNLTALAGLSYSSLGFIKMTGVGTLALDTNTYLTTSAAASTYVSGTGATGYYARFTGTRVISDGFIQTTSNITYVEGMGLSTLNGLDITGNYGAGGGGLKIRSYDETTGNAYIDFANTGGRMYLGLNRSTASGLMTNASSYATVLTTGLGTTNLEFGTNATKRLTLDGTTGAATFTSTISATGATLTGALSGTSATFSGEIGGTTANFSSTITGTGIASTSSAFILNNQTGASGTAQYYADFKANTTVIGRILRGNGASGYEANGLNIDNFAGMQVKLNALGGSGGTFAVTGGAATFSSSVTAGNNLSGANTIFKTQDVSGYGVGIGYLSGNYGYVTTQSAISPLALSIDGNPKLWVSTSGNVGIGTTSPGVKLTVFTSGQSFTSSTVTYSAGSSQGLLLDNSAGTSQSGNAIWFANSGLYSAISSTRVDTGTWGTDLRFYTHPDAVTNQYDVTERMRITSSGNVGIGTTAPGAPLEVRAGAGANYRIRANGTNVLLLQNYNDTDAYQDMQFAASTLIFNTGTAGGGSSSERMRITSGGTLCVGRTTSPSSAYTAAFQEAIAMYITANGNNMINWFNASGTYVSSIVINSSTVMYNTVSDYRLKEDLKSFKGLDLVSKINVYDYKWKSDGTRMYGVVAHELQEVLPDAVSGFKDAVNPDGTIKNQGVDYSKIVPVMVQAIKDLKAELDTLKNK